MGTWNKTSTVSVDGNGKIQFETSTLSPWAFVKASSGTHITLYFDGNGGKGYKSPIKSLEGTLITLPQNPYVYEDHDFTGWLVDGESTAREAGSTYTIPATDKYIRAQWSASATVKVTYKAGVGTGSNYVVTGITKGATHSLVTFSATSFVAPEGKVFDKWALGDASGTQYAEGANYVVNASTTFVAIYKDAPTPTFTGLCFTAGDDGATVTAPQSFDYSLDEGATWNTWPATSGVASHPYPTAIVKYWIDTNIGEGKGEEYATYYMYASGDPEETDQYLQNFAHWSKTETDALKAITVTIMEAISITPTDILYVRKNASTIVGEHGLGTFTATGYLYAQGNIMSLVDETCQSLTIPSKNCFCYLFDSCQSLVTAPELPATTLTEGCYQYMFNDNSLITAPVLPATTMQPYCYKYMFCSNVYLRKPPVLPATNLATSCYESMFYYCNLQWLPKLPATTLADNCYTGMFENCANLQVNDSPVSGVVEQSWTIPQTGTFTNTYLQSNMFKNCKGTRASNDMAGAQGQSYTYYTKNTPV